MFSSFFSFFFSFFFFGLANSLTSILHHQRGGTLAKLQHPPCQKSDSRKGMSTCDMRALGDGGVDNRSLCCLWEVGSEAAASLGSSGGEGRRGGEGQGERGRSGLPLSRLVHQC